MNSSKTRAKTAVNLSDLGISRNENFVSLNRLDIFPPPRPRNEHPVNCVSFPTKADIKESHSQWLPSPIPVPKQSHSARRFAKPSSLVNLSSIAMPPNMSPLLPSRSNPLGFHRYRKNLESSKIPGVSNSKTRISFRKLENSKQGSKASQKKVQEKAIQNSSAEGKALLETHEKSLSLVPVSSLSLVKCPGGSSSNAVGERMQVIRTDEERARNPETIRLDKCGLKQFPLISPSSEHSLKLLSMQHNQISKLENVPSLNRLVVLDMYDNRIERINGLQGLSSLRVLLLGKNRLRRIEGIDVLKRLEVLDLHGNQLRYVDNLSSLTALRVLNLAGNNFKTIRLGSYCLPSLTELNLKRNRIRSLEGLQKAPQLKKLLLANNDISSTSNIYHLRKLVFLQELLFEPNPICNSPDYANHILTVFPWLETLDRDEVSDELRTQAKMWHRKRIAEDEERRQEQMKARAPSSREEVILEARRRWQSVRNFVKSASTTQEPPTEIKPPKPKPKETKIALSNYIDIMREFKSYAKKAPEKISPPMELPLELPRVASDSELYKTEPSLNTKAELEAEIDSYTVLSEPEVTPEDFAISVPRTSIHKEPSKIAIVRPLVRSSVEEQTQKLEQDELSAESQLLAILKVEEINERSSSPKIEVTNYDDDLVRNLEVAETVLNEMEEKSDLSSITEYPENLQQIEAEINDAEESSQIEEPKELMFEEVPENIETNLNAVTENIEANLNEIAKSMTEPDLRNISPLKTEDEKDHDNAPGDLLDIFPKPRNRAKLLKRSTSSFSLGPQQDFSSVMKEQAVDTGRIQSATVGDRNYKLKAMRHLRSASFDVRYPSSESESSDDSSSFLTANTSDSHGPRSGRKFLSRAKTKVKKENKQIKAPFGGTRRPQTGVREGMKSGNSGRTLKRCDSAVSDMSSSVATAIKKQGADYLVEIDGKILNVYGQGALKFTLMGFPNNLASNITTAKFNYISFDTIIPYFGKLRQIYPNMEHFQFRANNLSTLAQINSLADLQGITSLHVTKEGNPLVANELWLSYAVYRLTHWGLKNVNGKDVSTELRSGGFTKCFDSLGYVALSCLPQTALTPLAKRLHTLQCFCCCSPSSSSDDSARRKGVPGGAAEASGNICNSWDDDPVLLDVIGKEALVYNPPAAGKDCTEERSEIPGRIITAGVEILQKLDLLETCWPSVLNELIQDILMDYLFMDTYMKKEYKKLQDIALMRKFP